MINSTDIDIDVADRDQLLKLVPHVSAMQRDGGRQRKHNTGVYFHQAPINPLTGMCSIDYNEAEQVGYFKIDILNVGLYKNITDPNHL